MPARGHLIAIATVFAAILRLMSAAIAANFGADDLASCRRLVSPSERLQCYEQLTPDPDREPATDASAGWRLVHTPGPDGESLSMMHTADTGRSDPDFAGFSIHCGKGGPEFLLIIIKPLPPRSRPVVRIAEPGSPISLRATLLPSGAALLLPPEVKALANGPWRRQSELKFVVSDGNASLQGVIPLGGFAQALDELSSSCPNR